MKFNFKIIKRGYFWLREFRLYVCILVVKDVEGRVLVFVWGGRINNVKSFFEWKC